MAAASGWHRPWEDSTERWYDDYEQRKDRLKKEGLPVYIRGFRDNDGFVAMYVGATEEVLPRAHRDRRFDLHFSLGKINHYESVGIPEHIVHAVIGVLNKRYAGTHRTLKIDELGAGGSAQFHKDEPLINDPLVKFLFANGGVAYKGEHISL